MPVIIAPAHQGGSQLKVAAGQFTSAAAVTSVVTGLNRVLSVVATVETDLTDAIVHTTAQIGNQAGTPAPGVVTIKTWANISGTDPTPAAEAAPWGAKVNWMAVGY